MRQVRTGANIQIQANPAIPPSLDKVDAEKSEDDADTEMDHMFPVNDVNTQSEVKDIICPPSRGAPNHLRSLF